MLNRLLTTKRNQFKSLCQINGLQLDYTLNKSGVAILKEVFINRNYADYFPFYQEATIVDIGAHFGYFSLFAAKNLASAARIIALEPSPANFGRLKANIEANQMNNIEAIQAAVADQNGYLDLYLGRTENHTIFPTRGAAVQRVEALTLATLFEQFRLQQIDFLKMDCEGAEYPILLQTPSSFFDRIKTISLEFHDQKDHRYTGLSLSKHLKKNGFEIVKFKHGKTHQNKNYGWIVATKDLRM